MLLENENALIYGTGIESGGNDRDDRQRHVRALFG